jgi:predicted transcriptional regulator
MTDAQIISWIFLSIALASQKEAADFASISSIADGINHAVPTHKELQTSISWLSRQGLIAKQGHKYHLTPTGRREYETASNETNLIRDIWRKLEVNLKNNA